MPIEDLERDSLALKYLSPGKGSVMAMKETV
jgi:hypothetical protein